MVALLRRDQILFTYLHLAADRELAHGLIRSGVIAIGYETVTDTRGGLPLLAPMSEVAGRMSVQVGAHWFWKRNRAGSAVLLGGVPGVPGSQGSDPGRWRRRGHQRGGAWPWGWRLM